MKADVTPRDQQVETYPLYAASALAANAFVRCAFAGELLIPGSHSSLLGQTETRKSPVVQDPPVSAQLGRPGRDQSAGGV